MIFVILVAAATWITVAIVRGFPSTFWEAISPFVTAIPVASVLSYVYQHHLWHWWPFQRWLARTPDLRGAWRATIRPAWFDPDTGMKGDPVQGYAQIDQTASSLCMRLFTHDSRSETFVFSIDEIEKEFRLTVIYENRPRMKDRPRIGTSHQGSAIYRFRGYRPNRIKGEYWTEIKNIGEIELCSRRQQEISSFEEGKRVFA